MKKIFFAIMSVAAVLNLASCEKLLTVSPIDEVSADTFLSTEQELKLFAMGLIEAYQPTADDIANGSDIASDLTAKRDASKFWYPGDIYKPNDRGAWSYTNVRRANVLINNMVRAKGNVSDEIYNHYQGVGRFWRAYFIWGKVQAYGDVPWQETLVDPKDSVSLYAPRDDREFVVHKCIEDLQYAVDNCLGDDNYKNVINKWIAAAALSRMALYEGTYRKYFDVNTSTYKPWTNKYETADQLLQIAVDASKVLMESGKFSLNPSYHDNFVTENLLGNPEMIWVAEYSTGDDATRTHSLTSDFRGSTVGGPSPTKEYVNHFLKIDGTPITDDKIPLYEEMAADNGRDPRLNNNVNHIGLTYKALSGETYAKWMPCQLTYSGYNLTKWNIEEEVQFQVAKCGNSIPIFRYAEVLLNYAEAKAELGQMNDAVWAESVGLIRKRAGLTYTGRPKAVDKMLYDYYATPYDFEEQGLQGNRANDLKAHLTADLLEIRRERVTELGYEGLRGDDLHRWHCLSLITEKNTNGRGNRGIWVTKEDAKNGFLFNPVFTPNAQGTGGYNYDAATDTYTVAADGKGGFDLIHGKVTFGSKASETSFGIANSGADQSFSLSEGDHGYLIFHYALEFALKKYLYPVNSNSVLLLNPNITQNWGWD